MAVQVIVRSNKCPQVMRRFPAEVDRIVRAQLLQSESDAKENVVKYDVIDTGNLLGSIFSQSTGQAQGMVASPAEYSAYQNFGTRYITGRPYFSDMVETARQEFPQRFRDLERSLA